MTDFIENEEGLPETADEAVDFIQTYSGDGMRSDVFDFMPEKEIEDFIDDMEYSFDGDFILLHFYSFDEIDNEFFQSKYTEEVRPVLLDKYKSYVINGLKLLTDETNSIYGMEDNLRELKRAAASLEEKINELKEREPCMSRSSGRECQMVCYPLRQNGRLIT